jgi:hypothetical protein
MIAVLVGILTVVCTIFTAFGIATVWACFTDEE